MDSLGLVRRTADCAGRVALTGRVNCDAASRIRARVVNRFHRKPQRSRYIATGPGVTPTRREDVRCIRRNVSRRSRCSSAQRGRLSVTAAAEQFGVTTETVRRDLAVLERGRHAPPRARRRRAGQRRGPASSSAWASGPAGWPSRRPRSPRAALDYLPGTNGSIILDGGTTTAALAELLPTDRRLLGRHQRRADRRPAGERAGHHRAHAGRAGARRDPVRRRRDGDPEARRPAGRRRLHRDERHHHDTTGSRPRTRTRRW